MEILQPSKVISVEGVVSRISNRIYIANELASKINPETLEKVAKVKRTAVSILGFLGFLNKDKK